MIRHNLKDAVKVAAETAADMVGVKRRKASTSVISTEVTGEGDDTVYRIEAEIEYERKQKKYVAYVHISGKVESFTFVE